MHDALEKEIFHYLQELGCCVNCSLRFLCDKSIDFSNVDKALQEKGIIDGETAENHPLKKAKSNSCLVCVGLLQHFTSDDILKHPDIKGASEYDSDTFTVSISMPASLLIREHAMRIHLEDKYGGFFEEKVEFALNKAWKIYMRNNIAQHINKTFENSDVCDFFLNVIVEYKDDEQDLAVLSEMHPKLFEMYTTKRVEPFSRKNVLSLLGRTGKSLFKMYGKVPPEVPTAHLTCKSIECKHNSIYIAGRYSKFSRELSQTPWIIDGVKTMETSVQDIIFDGIHEIFGIPKEKMVFSSSGREDCDVRCLGRGRPFYVEFSDPKKIKFTFDEFRTAEKKINESSLIKVQDLQRVNRTELAKVKEGEDSKTKHYVAICITQSTVTKEILEKINNHGKVQILQKTPIRVLHRRPLAVRPRLIEEMKAFPIEDYHNCFELHMITAAGTYVKEFVHGDFGRTKPNLGDIIGTDVDIAALDVVEINLDWPEPVSYEQ